MYFIGYVLPIPSLPFDPNTKFSILELRGFSPKCSQNIYLFQFRKQIKVRIIVFGELLRLIARKDCSVSG